MAVMTNKQLADKCVDIAKNYKTLYVLGCFGAPLTSSNVSRYTNNYDYNKKRASMIKKAANKSVFGFDCVCLIKAILWGWNGNTKAAYGGAKYASNGVPDIGADTMIKKCTGVSTNFSKIEVGEVVWMSGHIGVYIGDGLAVECTPSWENKVQITACNCSKSGYKRRNWTKHGKLPYVQYVKEAEKKVEKKEEKTEKPKTESTAKKTVKKGSKVKVKKGAKTYTGGSVASFVYNNVYTVDQLKGDRAVLDADGICTPFKVSDLVVQ